MTNIRIPEATENLRASLKRLYRTELAKEWGVDDDVIAAFIDGGHLSDADKQLVTSKMFPHLLFDVKTDRLISRPATYAIPQATDYLRRLVNDYENKSGLAHKAQVSFVHLDGFASGDRDLGPKEKQSLTRALGLNRDYDTKSDALVPLPPIATLPANPAPIVPRKDWREQQIPVLRTID
ncbi:hypothetical protein JQ543_05495 [Bradyrhizobium diazoefficiens]|nr:hypothetical protein [Bradyrhizobium diazoefficiens]MBR0847196.1 hypothetical protein [Bradyrhizobium diazoefficiens]